MSKMWEPLDHCFDNTAIESKMERIEITEPDKHAGKQPFPALPSYLAIANVLAFFAHQDIVSCLLNRLSKVSRMYSVQHAEILSEFVTQSPFIKHPFFGNQVTYQPNTCSYFCWPNDTSNESQRRVLEEDMKIYTISIK